MSLIGNLKNLPRHATREEERQWALKIIAKRKQLGLPDSYAIRGFTDVIKLNQGESN